MNNALPILPDGSSCFVAEIMSREEAMKLPPSERPICFRLSSEIYHKVWESIGQASMTFNAAAGNEVFNTESASKIAVSLLLAIADEVEGKNKPKEQSDSHASDSVGHTVRASTCEQGAVVGHDGTDYNRG